MAGNTRECSFDELRSELRQALKRHLSSDEVVHLCLESTRKPEVTLSDVLLVPGHVLRDMLSPPEYRATIITNRQVVTAIGYKGASARSIHLTDIVGVSERAGLNKGDYAIWVQGPGDIVLECEFHSVALANKFTEKLQSARDNVASGESSATYTDVSDRLRKLTKLFEDGLISEPEFLQKRQQLLDSL